MSKRTSTTRTFDKEAASHQQMNRLLPDDRARSTPRCVLLDENHSLLGGTTSA